MTIYLYIVSVHSNGIEKKAKVLRELREDIEINVQCAHRGHRLLCKGCHVEQKLKRKKGSQVTSACQRSGSDLIQDETKTRPGHLLEIKAV